VSVAAIFNVPSTDDELSEWAFSHMANHRDIIRVIYNVLGVALPEYALDPVNPDNTGVWERQHQEMHRDMNSLLGTSGFNLLGLDWRDQNRLSAWIVLNATEHRQVSDLLRIG
jgi:predicted acylesterase/phospholipase RssA